MKDIKACIRVHMLDKVEVDTSDSNDRLWPVLI